MKNPENSISKNSFLLLAHYATFAYQDLLFDYLTEKKAQRVTKMNFPLPELPYLKKLEITETKNGEKTSFKQIFTLYGQPFLAYPFQSIQLLLLIFLSSKKYDVIIAEDPLLAAIAIVFKWTKKCKKVIFYSHGVDKNRFSVSLLNFLYQQLDRFSAKNSSFNWFLNNTFFKIRKSQGIPEKNLFWMPASVPIKEISRKVTLFNHKIVFLGVVNKKNGAHIFIDIVKKIKKTIPDIQLDIIGNGDMIADIKEDIKKYELEKNISLLGLQEFKDFSQVLTNYSLGIAPYEDRFDTLTASSDSMKMRVYFAAGLPVVITEGFTFSEEVKKHELGDTVPFRAEDFANAIIKILSNKNKCLMLRKNALVYSEETDIHTIYDKTFSLIL